MKSFKQFVNEVKEPTGKLKDACWTGYTAVGMKMKNGKKVPNCVPEEVEITDDMLFDMLEEQGIDFELLSDEELFEVAAWQRKAGKDPKGGLNRKGIASYRREHPGSHLSMAVTTPPSKLKAGSKAANRRKSFCARMGGMPGPMKKPNGEPTRKALSLRKWNC